MFQYHLIDCNTGRIMAETTEDYAGAAGTTKTSGTKTVLFRGQAGHSYRARVDGAGQYRTPSGVAASYQPRLLGGSAPVFEANTSCMAAG